MRITGTTFSMGIALFDISIYLGKVQSRPKTYPFFEMYQIDLCLVYRPLFWRSLWPSLARGNIR